MEKNNTTSEDSLKATLKEIEKQYGAGAVMQLGQRSNVKVDVISSGSLLLNEALGVGGYPKGRIIEIYGPESSGKTTIALHAIAECQKKGGKAAFIDAEHAIDPTYAQALGVQIDDLLLSQPSSGEEGLEIADMLIKSNAISLLVVDSVPALVPKVELDGEMSDAQMGLQARMMSKALRKIAGNLDKNECTIIFINQLRDKIGTVYGNPEVTPGGRALKFYSTIRIDVRRGDALKDGTEIIGNAVTLKIVKNKVAPPFKIAQVEIYYGQGIAKDAEIIELAVQHGIIKKLGSWYEYDGVKIGQGKDNARNYIKQHPEIAKTIEDLVLASLEKLHG
jgi:recombination protein RecA